MKKLLKISVAVGIAAIGVTALIQSELFPRIREKFKKFDNEFAKKQCIKRRLKIIAEAMQRKINETECRTSCLNHQKKQEEYEKMNWDEEKTPRCEFPE